jgi:outer membrane protein TolC
MLQLKAIERQQTANYKGAKADYYPVITGGASYAWNNNTFDFRYNSWGLGVRLNYDILTWGRRSGHVKAAKCSLEAIKDRNERIWQNIYLEVQTAYLALRESRNRLSVLEKSLESARESFRLAQGRYEVGLGNSLEFTDAQLALQKAQLNYISALLDHYTAKATVEKATGLEVVNRKLSEKLLKENIIPCH